MDGRYVIDIEGYDVELDNYLRQRGAVDWTGWVSSFHVTPYTGCKPLHFAGCKAVHHNGQYSRIFMPDEQEALLFLLAHGDKIVSTHIRMINDLRKEIQ